MLVAPSVITTVFKLFFGMVIPETVNSSIGFPIVIVSISQS